MAAVGRRKRPLERAPRLLTGQSAQFKDFLELSSQIGHAIPGRGTHSIKGDTCSFHKRATQWSFRRAAFRVFLTVMDP